MAKARKSAAQAETRRIPRVGDRVIPPRSELIYEITHVGVDDSDVNIAVPGTNLERFRVRTDTLTFVDKPRPEPAAKPEPELDADQIIERITHVQRESTQRLVDDVDLLTKFLKTKGAPKAVISALEALRSDQQDSWQTAIDKITELLDDR
jgi:hypothetical protein